MTESEFIIPNFDVLRNYDRAHMLDTSYHRAKVLIEVAAHEQMRKEVEQTHKNGFGDLFMK